LASANPLGDWPRPALAMLHGLLPVQDVLKQLDAKQGDDREMALAEAYFYIGQYHLLHGDKDKAVTYFRKTRDQGITLYMEHVCAGKELQQLGVPP
jgi:lipoprotein NlpI